MEKININGSNIVVAQIPAGIATVDLTGTGATVDLDAGPASADIIKLTNNAAPAQTIVVPQPIVAMQDSTAYPIVPPAAFNPARTVGSWIKVINNATGGAMTIKGTLASGAATAAGLVLAAADVKLVMFDGVNTPFTLN